MRFALIGPAHPFRGGIAHYTALLSRALQERHEVRFVSLRRQYPRLLFPGTTQHDASRDALVVESIPLIVPLRPSSWRKACRTIADFRPDLVLVQWWHPFFAPCFGTIVRRLRRAHGIRTAFVVHNARGHERSFVERTLTRWALRGASHFLAHSQEDRGALEGMCPGATIEVSPHPNYEFFRTGEATLRPAEARARLELPEAPTVLFFGYVRRYKGLPVLVRAMAEVLHERPCRLLVVGEFYHDRRETEALVRELGIGNSVTLVDRYVANEEVGLYFAASDLVALPYRTASQSGVAQIAFAFGKPVVATRVGGLPEVVEDGVTGALVPPDDPHALAAAILHLFREARFEEMARAIESRRERFGWERIVERVEALAAEPAPR